MKRNWIKALVCAVLVATLALAPLSAMAAGVSGILIVNADSARLRSASDKSVVVAKLKKGTRVVYAGKHLGDMYLVRTSSGQVGYIWKQYLSAYGAAASKQVCRIKSTTAVYKNHKGKPKKIGSIGAGTTVIVYEVRGSWAYIKTLGGKSCYIKKAYLQGL